MCTCYKTKYTNEKCQLTWWGSWSGSAYVWVLPYSWPDEPDEPWEFDEPPEKLALPPATAVAEAENAAFGRFCCGSLKIIDKINSQSYLLLLLVTCRAPLRNENPARFVRDASTVCVSAETAISFSGVTTSMLAAKIAGTIVSTINPVSCLREKYFQMNSIYLELQKVEFSAAKKRLRQLDITTRIRFLRAQQWSFIRDNFHRSLWFFILRSELCARNEIFQSTKHHAKTRKSFSPWWFSF